MVSPELASSLVEEQFPALAPVRVQPLGAGFDNTAYTVNGEFVFRFPRRAIAVPWLVKETQVLPRIASRLPLSIPLPTHVGRPTERYAWPFAGYRMLAGRTACGLALDGDQRTRAAEPIAHFLKSLHAIRDVDCEGDTIGRLEVARRTPRARELLRKLNGWQLIGDTTPWLRILDQTYRPVRTDTLVHGDLYSRHLLVTDGRVSGVIDWGDVHRGDRAIDLSVAHIFLPPQAHDAFRRAYGEIDQETWVLAKCRALLHELYVIEYARDIKDADLLREALLALRTIAG